MDLGEMEAQIRREEVRVQDITEAEEMRALGKVYKPGVGYVD